jgi:hypothetical protein
MHRMARAAKDEEKLTQVSVEEAVAKCQQVSQKAHREQAVRAAKQTQLATKRHQLETKGLENRLLALNEQYAASQSNNVATQKHLDNTLLQNAQLHKYLESQTSQNTQLQEQIQFHLKAASNHQDEISRARDQQHNSMGSQSHNFPQGQMGLRAQIQQQQMQQQQQGQHQQSYQMGNNHMDSQQQGQHNGHQAAMFPQGPDNRPDNTYKGQYENTYKGHYGTG